jgi:ABC-type uncharacterized transport system permease subunit
VLEHFVSLPDIFSIIASISYLFATLAIVTRLFHPKGPNIVLVLLLGCIGIIAHAMGSSYSVFSVDTFSFSLPNVVSLVSLLITLTISAVALKFKVNLLLPVVYGFAGFWQLVVFFVPIGTETPVISEQLSVISHVSLSLIAYCILIIATLYAFQVAYINYKLKNKNLIAVSHLPPLMQVEGQLFTILAMGTLCLILSLVVGFVFLDNFFSSANAHKMFLSFAALITYCVILWGHFKQGWRGHKVLVLTIIASFLLTLAYFGSRFVKEFIIK